MTSRLAKILSRYDCKKTDLIPILQDIQAGYNYLPEDVLFEISRALRVPISQIYSTATFYSALSLKPRGKHLITVCVGTACHVRGASTILAELERKLGISANETTEDMKYTLETVNCLGCCAIGPIVVFDGKYYGQMSVKELNRIIK